MITTNYHEVLSLTLSPIKAVLAPDQVTWVTWRELAVKTTMETHTINFFLKDTQQRDNAGYHWESTKQTPVNAPRIEIFGANQTCVRVKDKAYFYSYQCCVGFQCGSVKVFCDDKYSLATKKHIATMCKGFTPVLPFEFCALITE